jgi:hypothetical protein
MAIGASPAINGTATVALGPDDVLSTVKTGTYTIEE